MLFLRARPFLHVSGIPTGDNVENRSVLYGVLEQAMVKQGAADLKTVLK